MRTIMVSANRWAHLRLTSQRIFRFVLWEGMWLLYEKVPWALGLSLGMLLSDGGWINTPSMFSTVGLSALPSRRSQHDDCTLLCCLVARSMAYIIVPFLRWNLEAVPIFCGGNLSYSVSCDWRLSRAFVTCGAVMSSSNSMETLWHHYCYCCQLLSKGTEGERSQDTCARSLRHR